VGLCLALLAASAAPALGAALPDPLAPKLRVGFVSHPITEKPTAAGSEATFDAQLAKAREAGASLVRIDIDWTVLQPYGSGDAGFAPDVLTKIDRFMAKAQAAGIDVVATVFGTPCWASVSCGSGKFALPRTGLYEGIVSYIAARWGRPVAPTPAVGQATALQAIEVWNEPNNAGFWAYPPASDPARAASEYAGLVREAKVGVLAAASRTLVLAGSLSHVGETSPVAGDIGAAAYLTSLYQQPGFVLAADGIAVHPYDVGPFDAANPIPHFETGVPALHQVIKRSAGPDAPVWITETGFSTCTTTTLCASEAAQATYVRREISTAASWPWAVAIAIYELHDENEKTWSPFEAQMGLFHENGSYPNQSLGAPKPAWQAFADAIASIWSSSSAARTGPGPTTGRGRARSARGRDRAGCSRRCWSPRRRRRRARPP
jgi:hypothetical protein